jgi:hypothetical protein
MSYASCRLCQKMGDEPYKLPSCDRDDCPDGKGHILHKLFIASAEPPSAQGEADDFIKELKGLPELIVQNVCEIPYRFGPEDHPNACVVSPEELRGIVERNIETLLERHPSPVAQGADLVALLEPLLQDLSKIDDIRKHSLTHKQVAEYENRRVRHCQEAIRQEVARHPSHPTNDKRDAERYRWLRKQMKWQNCWADENGSRIKWTIWVSMPEPYVKGELLTDETVPARLDAGIDAALSATPPSTPK